MRSRRLAWSVVALGMLTMVVSYIDRQTLSVIAPKVTAALDITETEYGWLTSAFSIAYLVGAPIAGWWIDRIGARRGLVISVIAWSAVAALHALVPNFAILFVLRIALGLAEAPSFSGAAQTVHRMLPPESRSRGFGLLFTGSSIGAMLVPPLAARLVAAFDWRITFIGTALVALIWVPLWIGLTRREDVRALLDRAPIAAPEDTINERPGFGVLLRDPRIVRGVIGILAIAPITGFVLLWGAKYLTRTFAIDQKLVGDYLWLPPLCLDAGALVFGDVAARLRRRTTEHRTPRALYAVAMVLAGSLVLLPSATGPWAAMAVCGTAVAGAGALYTLCTTDLMARMPPTIVSAAGGFLISSQSLALVVMGPVVGAAVDHFHGYAEVATFLGAWAIPASLVWIFWKPTA